MSKQAEWPTERTRSVSLAGRVIELQPRDGCACRPADGLPAARACAHWSHRLACPRTQSANQRVSVRTTCCSALIDRIQSRVSSDSCIVSLGSSEKDGVHVKHYYCTVAAKTSAPPRRLAKPESAPRRARRRRESSRRSMQSCANASAHSTRIIRHSRPKNTALHDGPAPTTTVEILSPLATIE